MAYALNLTSPVTGASQTLLTSPTYTFVKDNAPNSHSAQYAVTALGGTQTGVNVHSVSNPFTLTIEKPASSRSLGSANPSTGVISNVPRNTYKIRVRKGAVPAADQNAAVSVMEASIPIPAGADTYDLINCQAGISFLIGVLTQVSDEIGDMAGDGLLRES
jgi:hypothetical protein